MKTSSISDAGPVAIGFSINIATPGKYFMICISMSRPGCIEPLYIGGLPTMMAFGRSLNVIFLTNSSSVLNTFVSWYADLTKESHFSFKTDFARSVAGSMSATTLRRGPSLLQMMVQASAENHKTGTCCSILNEWFQGPSSEPETTLSATAIKASLRLKIPNIIFPAPINTILKSSPELG